MDRQLLAVGFALSLIVTFLVALGFAIAAPRSQAWSLPLALAVPVFVAVLNGSLRGRKKEELDGIVSLLMIGLLIWALRSAKPEQVEKPEFALAPQSKALTAH